MERKEGSSRQPNNNGKSSSQGNKADAKPRRKEPPHVSGANVNRIMRRVLPPSAKIAPEATEAIQKCVSEFIGFITTEAIDQSRSNARTTLTADDILHTMEYLGLTEYVPPLAIYLNRMRELEGSERGPFVPEQDGSTSAQGGVIPGQREVGRDGHGFK